EENFEPCAEIHRVRRGWNSDVAQVTSDITRRDIEASTKGNGKMHEISANALAIAVNFQRTFLWIGEVIAKGDVIMHPITDRLHARAACRKYFQNYPGRSGWSVHFGVATRKQKTECFVR